MLERYFVKPVTVDRIRASWIGGPIERYVGWLSEQGYASRNVFRRVPMLVQFGVFAAASGARRLDDLPGHVDAFVAKWLQTHSGRSSPAARRKIASNARGPIEQMLRVALPDLPAANHRPHLSDPFIGEAPCFFAYLREERVLRDNQKPMFSDNQRYISWWKNFARGYGRQVRSRRRRWPERPDCVSDMSDSLGVKVPCAT
jgi:integrase/recombinase XerD